jgi:hypothetical protein
MIYWIHLHFPEDNAVPPPLPLLKEQNESSTLGVVSSLLCVD